MKNIASYNEKWSHGNISYEDVWNDNTENGIYIIAQIITPPGMIISGKEVNGSFQLLTVFNYP